MKKHFLVLLGFLTINAEFTIEQFKACGLSLPTTYREFIITNSPNNYYSYYNDPFKDPRNYDEGERIRSVEYYKKRLNCLLDKFVCKKANLKELNELYFIVSNSFNKAVCSKFDVLFGCIFQGTTVTNISELNKAFAIIEDVDFIQNALRERSVTLRDIKSAKEEAERILKINKPSLLSQVSGKLLLVGMGALGVFLYMTNKAPTKVAV